MNAISRLCGILFLGCIVTGCAHYRPFTIELDQDYSGLRLLQFQHIAQQQRYDCGPGALAIVLNYWGVRKAPDEILAAIFQGKSPKQGTNAGDLVLYAQAQGLRAFLLRGELADIERQIDRGRPVIVCRPVLRGINHFEVVVGYDAVRDEVIIANPADGVVKCSGTYFEKIHRKSGRFMLLVVPEQAD